MRARSLVFICAFACSAAASAADGAPEQPQAENRGAAAAIGEVIERSLIAELDICGRESAAIKKQTSKLMKDWRKRNAAWVKASLAARAELRGSFLGDRPKENGEIFDSGFENAMVQAINRGPDYLRGFSDRTQRLAACETMVQDIRDGARDVPNVDANVAALLRRYFDR